MVRGELADLEQVQAERFDLGEDAVQCRPVQPPSEHGMRAVWCRGSPSSSCASTTVTYPMTGTVPSRTSREGQCPTCRGLGGIDLDVQYLPVITVPCPTCHGARFNDATLAEHLDRPENRERTSP